MKTTVGGITVYTCDDDRAKFELQYFNDDNVTVACSYFGSEEDASAFARYNGYPENKCVIFPYSRYIE